jgi:hypothetical protein
VTGHPLTGLFRVLHGNVVEGEQHKACVSLTVRVTGVHSDAYIKKTSGCGTYLYDVTGQDIVAALWSTLREGQLRISDKVVAVSVVSL